MNKSMLAGAVLLTGGILTVPVLEYAVAADQPELAQTGPQEHEAGRGEMGPMDGMHHRWIGGMMHRMAQMSPQQRCEDRLARRAGLVTYVVTKLNLNAQQKPLWDKLNTILQGNTDRERQLCATLKPADQRGQETLLDRIGRREQFLSARLQGLQQAKPAIEQLYGSLSPEQKAIVDHPFRH